MQRSIQKSQSILLGLTLVAALIPLLLTRQVAVSYDINDDGNTNIFDLLSMLGVLSSGNITYEAMGVYDLNADGKVNIFDLLAMLNRLSSEQPT